MDPLAPGRLAEPGSHPGVYFGRGVVLYGPVEITAGARIYDYAVIGVPSPDQLAEADPLSTTRIGANAIIGAHSVVHNGAALHNDVHLDARSVVGWQSQIGESSRLIYGAQTHWKTIVGRECTVGGFACDRSTIGDRAIMLGKLIHRLEDPKSSWDTTEEPSPCVEDGATVGFDALVIGSVTVHRDAYVAAGAIVTKDVAPDHIVVGCTHYSLEEWRLAKERCRGD